MKTKSKGQPGKASRRVKSPIFIEAPVPAYIKELLPEPVQLQDNFDAGDSSHDEFYTDRDSAEILAENGHEPEAPIDLLLQAIQCGLKRNGLTAENDTKANINNVGQSTTIISQILRSEKLGTRKYPNEKLFREIGRCILEDWKEQSKKNSTIDHLVNKAIRRAIKKFKSEMSKEIDFEERVKDIRKQFEKNYELNISRSIDRDVHWEREQILFLDAIDALARFGVPVDTTAIRAEFRARQVGPE